MTKETKYVTSPVTLWDEDTFSYHTKVGVESRQYPLLFIACGASEEESRFRAEMMIDKLKTASK